MITSLEIISYYTSLVLLRVSEAFGLAGLPSLSGKDPGRIGNAVRLVDTRTYRSNAAVDTQIGQYTLTDDNDAGIKRVRRTDPIDLTLFGPVCQWGTDEDRETRFGTSPDFLYFRVFAIMCFILTKTQTALRGRK